MTEVLSLSLRFISFLIINFFFIIFLKIFWENVKKIWFFDDIALAIGGDWND